MLNEMAELCSVYFKSLDLNKYIISKYITKDMGVMDTELINENFMIYLWADYSELH